MLPLTVPKLFGLKLYSVMSESMEPTLKVNAVVYVTPINASEVCEGDIISYVTSSGTNIVTTHRVVRIQDDGSFITKGDANNTEDPYPVVASRVIGREVFTIPFLGGLSTFIFTVPGACATVLVFVFALALWIYAGILDPSEQKERVQKPSNNNNGNGMIIAGVSLMGVALVAGIAWWLLNSLPERDYKELRNEFASSLTEGTSSDVQGTFGGGNSTAGLFAHTSSDQLETVLATYAETYKNLVGWILIPGTTIDYPIMHGSDDVFYLHHNYDGKYSRPGSIFLSADNSSDFSDRYNVIYGHNMNNGNMFAPILKYDEEPGFYQDHPTFYVATVEDGLREYEIFSYFYVYPTDAMYTISYYNQKDFDILVNSAKKASRVELPVEVSEEDEIAVLSTCNENGNLRFVVCGKMK